MRRCLFATGLLFVSVGWLTAQEAARPGNASTAPQSGQNVAKGTSQNTSEAGTTRSQQTTGRDENDSGAGQNRNATGQTPAARQNSNNRGQQEVNRTNQDVTNSVGRAGATGADSHAIGGHASNVNHYFITCLRADNHGEVEIGKLAAQKASNPEVKAFAQQMVKDHSAFLAKLDGIHQGGSESQATSHRTSDNSLNSNSNESRATDRSDATNSNDRSSRTSGAQRPNPSSVIPADAAARVEKSAESNDETRATDSSSPSKGRDATPGRTGTAAAAGQTGSRTATTHVTSNATMQSGGVAELTQVKQEIAQRCLASTQRELSEKQGHEFDKCYVGLQVVAHMQMVDTLSVLSQHTSGELQKVVTEGLETAQQHLDHAKHLAKQVDAGAERPNAQNRSEANRSEANRSEANRSEANRSEANRSEANRSEANRSEANRSEANRSEANRSEANRSEANRKGAEQGKRNEQ